MNKSDMVTVLITEVGSSYLRSMICNTDGTKMDIIATDVAKNVIDLQADTTSRLEQLVTTKNIINEHAKWSSEHTPTKLLTFGTQTIREAARLYPLELNKIVPDLYVMPSHQEALCSYFAAPNKADYTLIDFGSRSTEIVKGNKSDISSLSIISIPLSIIDVSKHVKSKNWNAIEIYKYLIDELGKHLANLSVSKDVVLMGRVFTNLSWVILNIGNPHIGGYSPKAVDGYKWDIANILEFTKHIISDSKRMELFIDAIKRTYPHKPGELDKQIYGLFIATILFRRMMAESANLCTYGTRHGAAKLLAKDAFVYY